MVRRDACKGNKYFLFDAFDTEMKDKCVNSGISNVSLLCREDVLRKARTQACCSGKTRCVRQLPLQTLTDDNCITEVFPT